MKFQFLTPFIFFIHGVLSASIESMDASSYPTYDEIVTYFTKLVETHSTLVQYRSLGKSIQGRDIPAYLFSDTSTSAIKDIPLETRPSAFFTALTHSREPLTLITLQKAAKKFLSVDSLDAKDTLKTTKVWFIPMVNPDGWMHALTHFSEDHDHQKKNLANSCRKNSTLSGVNLGHNWGYMWDTYLPELTQTIQHTFEDPCSIEYHGPYPFSEPESIAIRDFILKEKPKTGAFLHQRGFSSEKSRMILPYTYHHDPNKVTLIPDQEIFIKLSLAMNKASGNEYEVGSAYNLTGRAIPGSEIDWAFDQGNSFSIILQIAVQKDGYWPESTAFDSLTTKHVDTILLISRHARFLPNKKAIPHKQISKHLAKAIHLLPVLLSLILILLLAIGYVIARFLGYDNIFGRFKTFWNRIRWGDLRGGYTGLKQDGNLEDIEEEELLVIDDDDQDDGEGFSYSSGNRSHNHNNGIFLS